MKRALILASLLVSSATANAEIVTFDGIPSGNSPTLLASYVEGNVTVTSLNGNFWGFPTGSLHLDPEGFGNTVYDFSLAGGTFSFTGFDIVENQGGFLWLYGLDANGGLLTSTSSNALGTVNVSGFDGISTLRIVNVSSHLSVDNFNFVSAIPELGTWLLMLVGFGAAGTALRRSKKQIGLQTA